MTREIFTTPEGHASRRRFLAVAGTGAAIAGVAAMSPLSQAEASPAVQGIDVDGPLVAFVSDSSTNEVTVMHGEREVVVHDQQLVAQLTRTLATRSSAKGA